MIWVVTSRITASGVSGGTMSLRDQPGHVEEDPAILGGTTTRPAWIGDGGHTGYSSDHSSTDTFSGAETIQADPEGGWKH
jgi:hypothetical protein